MNIKIYKYYLVLVVFSFFILFIIYIKGYLNVYDISKETIAKTLPVRVNIDKELLKNLLPANESNL